MLHWQKLNASLRLFLLGGGLAFLLACSPPAEDPPASSWTPLYQSSNLSGHTVFPECNPGGTLSCTCSAEDVAIESFADYGEVTSNVRGEGLYVNAIGGKQFVDRFSDNASFALGTYRYTYQFRLKELPRPVVSQVQNGDAMHQMIQFWDGRNEVWDNTEKVSLEAAIYWDLNPWAADFGRFRVYTSAEAPSYLRLESTEAHLTPDLDWHTLQLVADLEARRYVSLSLDGTTFDLSEIPLLELPHPDWGRDLTWTLTTESMATFPGSCGSNVFQWTIQFRNVLFERLD